ncbi:yceI_3 [Blepharisma stoltei]|uniref:Major facilitator superfamily (MFS) profile domain-containing protein n=1 Tax=Blepharisma stoltei TaxID=1481888 RepID=A0AAU9JI80_9CILI|nr:unnamed protein product [Blepharisma stoltei]
MANVAETCLERIGWGRYQKLIFLCSCEAVATGIGSSMLISLIITQFPDLTNANKGVLGSILNLGLLLAAGYSGRKADKSGRIVLFKKGCYIMMLGLIALTLSHTFLSLLLSLFIIGLGCGLDMSITNSLLMESIPNSSRKYLALLSVSMNVGATFVYACALTIEYFKVITITDWRAAAIGFTILHGIFIYLRSFLEEGPVFLYDKGKIEEMKEVLIKIAKFNGNDSFDIDIKDLMEKNNTKKGSFGELFKAPLSTVTFSLTTIFFLTFLSLQGIIMFMPKIIVTENKLEKYVLLSFQQVCGLPGKFLGAKLIDTSLGRKLTTVLSFFLVAVTLFGFSLASGFTEYIIASFAFGNAVNLSVSCLYAITPESYPPSNRSLAFGFMMGISRIGAMISSMTTGKMLDKHGISATLSYSAFIFVLAGSASLKLKETRDDVKLKSK